MKHFNLSSLLGATVLALGLVTLNANLPASAQTSTGSSTGTAGTSSTTQGSDYSRNDDKPDLGWLGLLGLIGLAGLRRKHETPTTQRDPAYRNPAYQDPDSGIRR
jgi:hypothetical protein